MADRSKGQARQARTTRPFTRKKKTGYATNIYLRIHDVILDIQKLGGILTAKINTPGLELIPTEDCIKTTDRFTFCTLTCDSKAVAKKLKNLFLKDRHLFTPLIDCSFEDFLSAEMCHIKLLRTKEDLRQKVEKEFNKRSEQVLRVHDQKMRETQQRIDTTTENLRDLYTARQAREEIAALEHKLKELMQQQREYTTAVLGFKQSLTTLLQNDSFNNDVQDLRKRFGVECCRLDKALPMYARRQDILKVIEENPVSILLAETGSGKSTQVVQYLLETGFAKQGKIVCTQPRKVAAVSLATHVAQELASNVGREVGYKVGTKVKSSPSTRVVYMTDHALLNECLTDPDLKAFSCVVVDEAHERSLFTDLLLSMVKKCVQHRPDLRVIITSATIDPQVFVNFFGSCPIVQVSGRAFPVEVIWQNSANEENDFESYVDAALDKAVEIHEKEPAGDILVFLTSAVEIQKCCDVFQERMKDRTDYKCFQLHGQLQTDEQQKVFEPLDGKRRKIVFATNCAETSITIDGIKYVVDTGVAKEMRYDPKRNIRSLDVTVISQSSAVQRKGRAGRTAPGKCYRLYSEHSFQSMDKISLPEILKTHLGHALLKLAELGVTSDMYDFVQSPSQEAISVALTSLHRLGALDQGKITETGRWVAKLPFDPKLGLMTLYGHKQGLLYDTVVLASLVSAGSSLFYRGTTDKEHQNLNKAKIQFCHSGGDNITSLQVYKTWQKVDEKQKNKWCTEHSINAKVIRGARETVNEVSKTLKTDQQVETVHQFSEVEDINDKLRQILFVCNSSNLCHFLGRQRAGYFAAQASKQVHVHPSSSLCFLASQSEWVIYDQLLHTSRDFITGVTPVDERWVHRLKREHCGFDVETVRQKKLSNILTQPAGSHAYFTMVGPRYTRLRQLQESCGDQESKVVVLEGSHETREVKVFCTEATDPVTLELTQLAKNAMAEVEQEVWEVSIGNEQSGLRVILGQGSSIASTEDILMPSETRKIFINNSAENVTKDEIMQKFQVFGEVSRIQQFSGGKNWGFLEFRTAAQAQAAVEGTKDDERNVAQLEHRSRAKHNAEFKARLSWNRRRAKGFGFANISPVYISKCLSIGSLYIGENLVRVRQNKKNENGLHLTNLPSDVTEDLIKRSLLHTLGENEDSKDIVESVSVPRETVGTTGRQELNRLANNIQREVESHLIASTVQVSVFPPKTEKTATFVGEARFSDPIEGLAACKALRINFTLQGIKVSVEPIISTSLRVPKCIYDACKTLIDELVKTQLQDMGIEVQVRFQKTGNYLISLKGDGMEDIVKARTFLNEVIKGDVLDCNSNATIKHLLTSSGRQMLKEVEKKTSAYISVDNRLRTVAIHGSTVICSKARCQINEYLQEIVKGTGEEVSLSGSDKPPGLLKALHDQYGEDLDTLRQQTGLHNILIDFGRHKLKLTGLPQSLQRAREAIDRVQKTVEATSDKRPPQEDESIDCAACFCPIDEGHLYRLEACAHPFCSSCIGRQVTIAIKENQLPVVCCHDGCDRPLAWRDFRHLSRENHFTLPALASAALSAFVLANRDKARFCSTPDCPMAYRVTNEDNPQIFLCPECGMTICTACHEQGHDGMSCAMLRSSKDPDKGVDAWVLQDRKNRKACPGCKTPIQKAGGCNKMHCTACGAVFCWICGKKFATETLCYDHLTRDHNGIFDERELLGL